MVPAETTPIKVGAGVLVSVSLYPHAGNWVVYGAISHGSGGSAIVYVLSSAGLSASMIKDVTLHGSIVITKN